MHLFECPAVILAAGTGTRMQEVEDIKNKTLLPIIQEFTIFDILIFKLIKANVKNIYVVVGYNADNLIRYIKQKQYLRKDLFVNHLKMAKEVKITPITAQPEFIEGPIFTLLSLKIKDKNALIPEIIKDLPSKPRFFTIIPSDTIFNSEILEKIMNCEISVNNASNNMDSEKRTYPFCHVFGMGLSNSIIDSLQPQYPSTFGYIEYDANNKIMQLKKGQLKTIMNESNALLQIPIVSISEDFLYFAEDIINKGEEWTRLTEVINRLNHQKELIQLHNIPFNSGINPFYDIDTPDAYLKNKDNISLLK